MAPGLTIAQKQAASTTQATTQPRMKGSPEILNIILTEYVDGRGEQSIPEVILPIICTCSLFKQILIPRSYKHVTLKGPEGYFLFLSQPDLESYKYVDSITMIAPDLVTRASNEKEEASVKALEKRAAAYKVVLAGAVGQEAGGELWPRNVHYELVGGKLRKHQNFVYICRLMRLFTPRSVEVAGGSLVSSFDPDTIPSKKGRWTIPLLIYQDIYTNHCLYHVDLSGFPGIFPFQNRFDAIHVPVVTPTYTDVALYRKRHHLHQAWRMLDGLSRWLGLVEVPVRLIAAEEPHGFCSATGSDGRVVRHANIRTDCCPGPCEEPKNEYMTYLNEFLSTQEDHGAVSSRLLAVCVREEWIATIGPGVLTFPWPGRL